MQLKQIIQRIQSLYSKGVQSDDSRLSSRHIYNKLQSVRSRLLYEKINKKQFIAQSNYQVIPCAELIEVPVHDCPCIPCKGCQVFRTKYPFPKPLTSISRHQIKSVTSLDGEIIYDEVFWETIKYQRHQKFTAAKPGYYLPNEYLYIESQNEAEVIRIELLAENPIDVWNYPSYCETENNDCTSYLDKEFPFDNTMLDALIELCVQELIMLFNQNREDSSNNAKDNTEQETK